MAWLTIMALLMLASGCRPRMTPAQALHNAIEAGDTAAAERLLDSGVDPNSPDDVWDTCTHLAALAGKPEMLQACLDHGGSVSVQDYYGMTPLDRAVEFANLPNVRILLAGGSAPTIRAYAVLNDVDQVKRMLDAEADPNSADGEDNTALHLAAEHGYLDMAKLLVSGGANLNASEGVSYTPLHWAATFNQIEVARFLLDHGAHASALDDEDFTPLHLAAQQGHVEMVKLLLARGARTDIKCIDGSTPLGRAVDHGKPEVADILRRHEAPK